mgnify:FL=1
MNVYDSLGIIDEFQQRCLPIALFAVFFSYDDSYLCPFVLWIEVEQVYHAVKRPALIGHDQPYLLVGVDVASGIGYELMQDEARIWRVDISNAPCVVVVLDGIHHVKVFWLHGPKDDIRQFVFSHFYYICILRRIRPSFFTLYSSLFVLPSSFLTLKSLMVGDDHVFVGVVHRNECLGTIIVVHGRQNVGVGKCG